MPGEKESWIGAPVPRQEDAALLTGLLRPRHDRSGGVAFSEIAQRQGDFTIAAVAGAGAGARAIGEAFEQAGGGKG